MLSFQVGGPDSPYLPT